MMLQPESVEVRREKIFIPASMTPKEIRGEYGLDQVSANNAKKKVSS